MLRLLHDCCPLDVELQFQARWRAVPLAHWLSPDCVNPLSLWLAKSCPKSCPRGSAAAVANLVSGRGRRDVSSRPFPSNFNPSNDFLHQMPPAKGTRVSVSISRHQHRHQHALLFILSSSLLQLYRGTLRVRLFTRAPKIQRAGSTNSVLSGTLSVRDKNTHI